MNSSAAKMFSSIQIFSLYKQFILSSYKRLYFSTCVPNSVSQSAAHHYHDTYLPENQNDENQNDENQNLNDENHDFMVLQKPVRVRFAPSPTGELHLGGLRTALYNVLVLKKYRNAVKTKHIQRTQELPDAMIVRIEDTDQKRKVEGATERILEGLKQFDIEYDEGPGKNQPTNCGPYIQSQRVELYQKHAMQLVKSGNAYPCFCTEERLETIRQLQLKKGLPPAYDKLCSVTRTEEALEKIDTAKSTGRNFVIRLRVPNHGFTAFRDAVLGVQSFPNLRIDDQVLLKADGFPTYHLAVVVDDHYMGVTHVIRGNEWLPSTPKHILLYKAFGWAPPIIAHLPLLLNRDGSKLSKRNMDASLNSYIQRGYLPLAVVNFVASLGCNTLANLNGIHTLDELADRFVLSQISRNGVIFDLARLDQLNRALMLKMKEESPSELIKLLRERFEKLYPDSELARSDEYISNVASLLLSEMPVHTLNDFLREEYLFMDPNYSCDAAQQFTQLLANTRDETLQICNELIETIRTIDPHESNHHTRIHDAVKSVTRAGSHKAKTVWGVLRCAVTGTIVAPPIALVCELIGLTNVLRRLQNFRHHLGSLE